MQQVLLSLFLCFLAVNIFAQDPLNHQFDLYQKTKSRGKLYVHYDKNVYAGNETIWFTGYMVNTQEVKKHTLMSVSLIRESDSQVVLENRFEMKDGLVFGAIMLPDSVPIGNYKLLAITDYVINQEPEASFTQYITVKSGSEPAFKARMNVLDVKGSRQQIVVWATAVDNTFFKHPVDVTYTYAGERKTIKSDKTGRAVIELDYQQNINDPMLYVKVVNGSDSTFVSMPIKEQMAIPHVTFYPEGGDLVSGLNNKVGWEIRDGNRQPVKAKAYLYKNDQQIAAVQSSDFGLGSFDVFAEEGSTFTLRVVGNKDMKDTVFTLPAAKSKGLVLSVQHAVVTDGFLVCTISTSEEQVAHLRIHDFKTVFVYAKIGIKPGKRTIRLPVKNVPKGLMSITLTDASERPLAERMIFTHYDNTQKLGIALEKNEYQTREKVMLKLIPQGTVQKSVVSVAVVHDDRIEPGKMTDIENYTYLYSELAAVPISEKDNIYREKKYLEDVLLIKGWRKYSWDDLVKTTVQDTGKVYGNLKYLGIVTKGKRPLGRSFDLGILLGKELKMMPTDPQGIFDLNRPELHLEVGKKLFFFVNNNRSLTLSIDNQLLKMSQRLARLTSASEKPPMLSLADNGQMFFGMNEKTIRIEEVRVSREAARGALGPNVCGDYVCSYNVLNCTNHYGDPRNTAPVQGKEYKYYGGMGREMIIYPGCTASGRDVGFFTRVEGIGRHKVFYADTYGNPQEPAFYSTVYWNHALVLNRGKESTIEFHTGDIAGKHRVVVQGVAVGQDEVVFGEQFFEVVGK